MSGIRFSFKLRRATDAGAENQHGTPGGGRDKGRISGMRIMGIILLALAGFLAWKSNWFHAEKDLSRYPEIQLTYTTCKFERITHSKGSSTRQIVLLTADGRYVMEDGVWKGHFDGPTLAGSLAGGGMVRVWLHPEYSHALRGILGGKVDVPPQWGLEYDQRNMRTGMWTAAGLTLAGAWLLWWKR